MNSKEAKGLLKGIEWQEGKVVPLLEGPYRYRIMVHCSAGGRQETEFSNGNRKYFCYVELTAPNGTWIEKGAGIVPVLPDGRLIMVVEQRPPQDRYPDRPMVARIGGRDVDLGKFGPYSSLEFPGGAVDPNEGLKAGFLRELAEETGVENQSAVFYSRNQPFYPFGSDLALRQFVGVVFLSGLSYKEKTKGDGGLNIFALTEEEITFNIRKGVIHSAQAALMQWSFYRELVDIKTNLKAIEGLESMGYLSVSTVKIRR